MYSSSLAKDHAADEHLVNGLPTIPEIESIRLSEDNVAAFSMPQEVLTFTPDDTAVMAAFKNGTKERNIYCNTELTDAELQSLSRLQEEVRARGLCFLPSVASAVMRYLSRSQGDAHRALKEMTATQDWRQCYFKSGPITDVAMAEDLKHGIVYFCGRDKHLRPALVIRPGRIPAEWKKNKESWRVIRLLVFSLEYLLRYLVYPGKVETSAVLIDFKGVSVSQLQSKDSIREICTVLGSHYIYRVSKFYMCNAPSMVQKAGWMLTRLMAERAQQKLHLVKSVSELHTDFALHQLEEDLGGTQPAFSIFFPYPLQAGPFVAGCCTGADANAVAYTHRAFTAEGMCGRAWNPKLSREENQAVAASSSTCCKAPTLAPWQASCLRKLEGPEDSICIAAQNVELQTCERPVLLGSPIGVVKDHGLPGSGIGGNDTLTSGFDAFDYDEWSLVESSTAIGINKVRESPFLKASLMQSVVFDRHPANCPVIEDRQVKPSGAFACVTCRTK